jgi:hypothetical protein
MLIKIANTLGKPFRSKNRLKGYSMREKRTANDNGIRRVLATDKKIKNRAIINSVAAILMLAGESVLGRIIKAKVMKS